MATSYLLRLPRQYMRALAGFGSTAGSYFLKRAAVSSPPPDRLLRQIWPWVDAAAQAYARGEIRPADLTGREFNGLLKELRLIFLQDAAVLQPTYPDLPFWRLPVFRAPEWHAFAEAVRHCQEVEEEPADVRIRAVVPTIAEAVHGATNRVSTLLVDTRDTLVAAVGAVGTSLGDQVAELRSTVVSQHRRRPEALLLVPPDAVKPEFLAAENLRRTEPEEGVQSSTAVDDAAPVVASTSSASIAAVAAPVRGSSPEPIAASMRSVTEVLREWLHGLDRGEGGAATPSLIELDRRFGPKWRHSMALKTRYFNRKRLVEYVQQKAKERGKGLWEVAEELDRLAWSPDKMVRLIRDGSDPLPPP